MMSKKIPNFKNRQEMAKWFDTHDLGNYQDEFKTVKAKFAKNLTSTLNIRLDSKTIENLRTKAHQKGIGPTTLVRMWILEKLRSPNI